MDKGDESAIRRLLFQKQADRAAETVCLAKIQSSRAGFDIHPSGRVMGWVGPCI